MICFVIFEPPVFKERDGQGGKEKTKGGHDRIHEGIAEFRHKEKYDDHNVREHQNQKLARPTRFPRFISLHPFITRFDFVELPL